jgi:hypothetical protein
MSKPVEERYEGAAQEKATCARPTRDQHIPVSPSQIRLKPLCIQHFRGGSSVQGTEPVQQQVVHPVEGVDHIEAISRGRIHLYRDCQPSTRLTVSYWTMLTSAMNGVNSVSAVPRYTFEVKRPSARST